MGSNAKIICCDLKDVSPFYLLFFHVCLFLKCLSNCWKQEVLSDWHFSKLKSLSHMQSISEVLRNIHYLESCVNWEQGSLFKDICTANFTPQGLVIFQEKRWCCCVVNESRTLCPSDKGRFLMEQANQLRDSDDVFESATCFRLPCQKHDLSCKLYNI